MGVMLQRTFQFLRSFADVCENMPIFAKMYNCFCENIYIFAKIHRFLRKLPIFVKIYDFCENLQFCWAVGSSQSLVVPE